MRYLTAILCPPLAVFLCGEIAAGFCNLVLFAISIYALTFCFLPFLFPIPMVHALCVSASWHAEQKAKLIAEQRAKLIAEQRAKLIVEAIEKNR